LIVPIVKRTIRRRLDLGGQFELLLDCEGHDEPDSADGHEYTLEGSTSDDPVETNWNIQEIIEKYAPGQRPDSTGKIRFKATLNIDGQQIKNPMFGVESYLAPGLVWTHTFVSVKLRSAWVRALGTVDNPDSGGGGQSPPELQGNRFWFNIRMTANWRGNIWKLSRSWMMTGRGGYVPELYKPE